MKKKKTRLFFAKLIVALLLTGWLAAFCTLYFVGALSENRTLLFVMLGVAAVFVVAEGAVLGLEEAVQRREQEEKAALRQIEEIEEFLRENEKKGGEK